jgi:hypothetical protein
MPAMTVPAPVPPPVIQAARSPPTAAGLRDPRALVLLAWIASLVLLGALAWAGIAWRTSVMHAWPPSERLYAALGLLRGPPAR